ncbi:acetyltransferase [Vibrio sp. CAU 1672]|uniref:acetyltransferase n=1 Tax=Vibrio sp. CAU 1672 TaxID=3032594 RepID=UPI0023DA261C|nr:acetyltransferase [Vibrio sp. CAU 1672]MDF2153919.1 acetyltransferase [Vibrio sp. CAU 1672]
MSNSNLKPLVVLGGGGHASVLVDLLRAQQREIRAVICPDDLGARAAFAGLTHFTDDDDVFQFSPEEVLLVNGIGALPQSTLRQKLSEYFIAHGYRFETVVALSAQVSPYAKLEAGVQVFPNAVIQAGVMIGSHSIINTGAIVEHDCVIGPFNHLAPRATLCGQVQTAGNVYIGAGATVIQNINLAENVVVGAGAVINQNVLPSQVCYPGRVTFKSSK